MNAKHIFISFLIAFMAIALPQQAAAQSRSKKSSKKDEGFSLKERLWYGGSIGAGGYSGVFAIGIAPMVGFKIIGPLSIGPRTSFTFRSERYFGAKAVNLWDTEAGVFARVKIFRGVFAQGEISREWQQFADPANQTGTKIPHVTIPRNNQYLGLGYNSSGGRGGGGFDIAIMYNLAVANDANTLQNPWEYRAGFTWNF